MRITDIHLENFKRFSDLTIEGIPEDSKLVLLIGSNGSGKSSLFDAFTYYMNIAKFDTYTGGDYPDYFSKDKKNPPTVKIEFADGSNLDLKNGAEQNPNIIKKEDLFYGRTSFRQIPRLTRTALGQNGEVDIKKDSDRPRFFIDRDDRFENDLEYITGIILKDFFRANDSNEQIKAKYIDPINDALARIFGDANGTKLELIEIIPPLEGKISQINFRKGSSEIHYNFLSAGEKEIINILFNLLSRRDLYQNTIYFFDEIDLHLNTTLQSRLLQEITENWIPGNSQLWVASHSLGFIEYANQSEFASIIDFDSFDFDYPKNLSAAPKGDPDVYDVAVGKDLLPSLFKDMNIYFVENQDKNYYGVIGIANTVFVSENNRNSVFHKVRSSNSHGIVDRDFLTDDDIEEIKKEYPRLVILEYYSIENYLYHPDNLEEYYRRLNKDFDKSTYITDLTNSKNLAADSIIPVLAMKRTEYPYFKEPKYNGTTLQNRFKNDGENEKQSTLLAKTIKNDDFDEYYKSIPMKTYCTHLLQRQNIPKPDLAKTEWFKNKITNLL